MAILKCVRCSRPGLVRDESGLVFCPDCRHSYPANGGIPDFRPPAPWPLPRLYQDDDYLAWLDFQSKSKEYFYKPGSLMAYVQNAGHRIIRRMCRRRRLGHLLDLGCGDGHHYPYLDQTDGYLGLDMDQKSLEAARSRFPRLSLIRADACNIPINDGQVDAVISIYALEHFIYLDRVLEEIERVLAPDGDLFISVPTEGSLAWSAGRRLTTARKFTSIAMNYTRAQEIDHINCVWQLDRAIRRHFRVVERVMFPLALPIFQLNLVVAYHCRAR
ncbi:MAG: methyltransferase domain-containing protein [Thermodesulfobacteriota bacterium]